MINGTEAVYDGADHRDAGEDAEVRPVQGRSIGLICKGLGILEPSYCLWRRDYGGLKLDQAKCLKDLERENARPHHLLFCVPRSPWS